jgi:hypothetical protein
VHEYGGHKDSADLELARQGAKEGNPAQNADCKSIAQIGDKPDKGRTVVAPGLAAGKRAGDTRALLAAVSGRNHATVFAGARDAVEHSPGGE